MAVPNSNVDQLTAITNDYFMDDIPDLVHNQNVFFKVAASKQRMAPGGAKIDQPLLYQFTQDGAYFDFEKGSTAAEDQITRAEYNWKLYRQRIVVSEPEMDRNSGPEAVFNMLETKVKGAGMAIRDALGTDLFNPANGDSGRPINSLHNLIGDGTYPDDAYVGGSAAGPSISGGIDKNTATNAFFRGTNFDFGGNTLGINDDMIQAWYAAVDGAIHPNLILSHPTPLREHHQELVGSTSIQNRQETFTNTEEMLSGFTVYRFQGANWITDLHISLFELFMLNMDFIHMVVHTKRNFQLKPFVQPEDQDVNIAWIKWMGNITSSDPSRSVIMFT